MIREKDKSIGISVLAAALALTGAPLPDIDPPAIAPASAASAAPASPPVDNDIVVESRSTAGDPMMQANVESFKVTQAVDEAVIGPVARAYGESVPRPVRKGFRNFLTNLREPLVALNYLLQLKPGKAGETLGRFAINSTIGVAGVLDQAKRKPFNLPRRRNGFANTMGFYGVKPGAFFYLPLIGPTTVRDFFGTVLDQAIAPIAIPRPLDQPEYIVPIGVLTALDYRNEYDEDVTALRESRDPYGNARQTYLDRRKAEIDALRRKGRMR